VVLVGWIHDELVACCRPDIADRVGEIMVRRAKEAGQPFNFNVPLDADYKVGRSWAGDLVNNEITPEPPKADSEPKPELKSESKSEPELKPKKPEPQRGDGSRTAAVEDKYAEEHTGEPFDDWWLRKQGYELRSEFNYTLPDTTLVCQQLRYELREGVSQTIKKPRKRFLPRRWVDGAWVLGAGDRRVLFNWSDIVGAGPGATVIITEGESNAADLIQAGLLATTVLSHQWTPECVAALTGYHLIILEDHDDDGRRLAEDARRKLRPVAASMRVVPYTHLWEHLPPEQRGTQPARNDDVSDWIKQGGDPTKLIEICREIPSVRFMIAPIREWDDKSPPEIGYGVDNRFPLKVVNLISGEGGVGKSSMAQQLGVAHAIQRECEWVSCTPRQGPAIYVECEDPLDVLHWRQDVIAKHYGVSHHTIADSGFVLLPWADEKEPTILATAPGKNGIIHPTPQYDELYTMAGDIKPVMIGIASAAIVFAGNENVRPEVQQFMWLLRRLAQVSGGYVLLVAQPSLTGIGDTSISHAGLSGTTQWHNGARGRAVLRAIKPQGSDTDTGLREIKFYKNQYGAISASCCVRYNNGLFLPVEGMTLNAAERAVKAEEVFLLLLKKFTEQKQKVNHLVGRNYAPTQFVEQTEAAGIDKKELKAAMQRLLDAGMIEICELPGKPSRPTYYLALKGSP
jgi:RecA-family ATPase